MKITNYQDTDLGPIDPDQAAKVMADAYKRLSDLNKWISAGTALGLYRDNDFIFGDTDVDIACLGYPDIDEDIKAALGGYELIRDAYFDGQPMQLAFKKDGVVLDVYIHWKHDTRYFNASQYGIQLMPEEIYEHLVELPTKYGAFNFPHPVEEYLAIRYGDDWRTPRDGKPIFWVAEEFLHAI